MYVETDSDMINQAFRKMEMVEADSPDTSPVDKKWKSADEETLAKLYGLI